MEDLLSNMVKGAADIRQATVDSATAFNRIATRAQGLLARQQLRAVERCIETGTRQLRLVAEVRDPRDLLMSQAEVAKELGKELLAVAQESSELQAQVRSELGRWAVDGIESARKMGAKTGSAPKLRSAPRGAKKAA